MRSFHFARRVSTTNESAQLEARSRLGKRILEETQKGNLRRQVLPNLIRSAWTFGMVLGELLYPVEAKTMLEVQVHRAWLLSVCLCFLLSPLSLTLPCHLLVTTASETTRDADGHISRNDLEYVQRRRLDGG